MPGTRVLYDNGGTDIVYATATDFLGGANATTALNVPAGVAIVRVHIAASGTPKLRYKYGASTQWVTANNNVALVAATGNVFDIIIGSSGTAGRTLTIGLDADATVYVLVIHGIVDPGS